MKVLVTGGLGFIGSHTVVELLNKDYDVVVVDNLVNSKEHVKNKIEKITQKKFAFYELDLCDKEKLKVIFKENNIDSVIHFAGLKAVGESTKEPLMYYHNNLISTITLLEVMKENNCKNIVFSSSATVYGEQDTPKCVETMNKKTPSSPYGKTKDMIEEILKDLYESDKEWNITLLRYFNPVGAHKSGLIGEDPNGIPNNLMPYILKVAVGVLPELTIYGKDYDTPDGTCIRDYIHVVDLAKGHIAALEKLYSQNSLLKIYNLGSGNGISVQEVVDTFEKVNNIKLNYKYGEKREGDLKEFYADPSKAYEELGWKVELTLEDMCRDAYNFAINNFK